ncbi:DUF4381 family protein [Stenotrophomonas sp.]|uniref:DUF4381 family protein n=1 Tax=Stenotrophomonas sp. TaxID=69392 RepID=UPI002D539632|nr:DUF4381 family protein [Stenotrophomonas sp.]HYQ25256.1 DUF4381 family protein [Stenotrophomonas sp.]
MSAALPLRDVALPPSPPWWPPAPGWLMLIGALLLVLGIVVFIGQRRRRRRRRWLQLFDQELQAAPTAAAELAAIAGLLRRAARLAQPGSEALHDQAWWQRIDPKEQLAGPQRKLLAEGAYRPQVAADEVAELRGWARERYLQLLQERRR